jgi:hypothetical protein
MSKQQGKGSRKALGYSVLVIVGAVVACCVLCFGYGAVVNTLRQAGVLPSVTPRPTGTPTPTATATPGPPTAYMAPSATPTSTPLPTVDTTGCSLGATFELDVTVPDNARVALGEPFVKTWRLRNTGTCEWERGYHLVFVDGERMDCPEMVAMPPTAPGEASDISVQLVAPTSAGTYRGYWQVCVNETECFGDRIYVQISAFDPFAPTATPVPAPTARPVITYRCGAICKDGWQSSATGSGACSHHGGVHHWLYCER